MECLKCNCTKFSTNRVRFCPEIKGEIVEVISPSFVCKKCGETLMNTEQMDLLRRAAADKYRSDRGLLTSGQIVALRKRLKMSQVEFANYLKVGQASIKRWETYFVQDEGQNEHIKIKSEEDSAEWNALSVHWNNIPEDAFSGYCKFNFELFKNVVLALVKFCKSPLYINKALFYVDFVHFKRNGKSLTGSRYVPLEYGPCPDQFQGIFRSLKNMGILSENGKHDLVPNQEADLSKFDDRELESLNKVLDHVKNDSGHSLYKLSHEEAAFNETSFGALISYVLAKNLKI